MRDSRTKRQGYAHARMFPSRRTQDLEQAARECGALTHGEKPGGGQAFFGLVHLESNTVVVNAHRGVTAGQSDRDVDARR